MIYLDNAATTQVSAAALEAALPFMTEQYGNPSSLHRPGREAKAAVETARREAASLFGCEEGHILFTSGGSEANSMVFRCVAPYLRSAGKTHILVSKTEHESVLKAARSLEEEGFQVQMIPVAANGTVSPHVLDTMIREDTGLVSVMYVNNETGAVNPVEEIGEICARRGAWFHTDCVQAAGAQSLDVSRIGCDFATVSAHKLHGFKGVGALYIKNPAIPFEPLIYGGEEQEFGRRGGTENVPGIVAFGKACAIAAGEQPENLIAVSTLRQRFYAVLTEELRKQGIPEAVRVNGPLVVVPGKILNLTVFGVDAQTLLLLLDSFGICVSAGSACRSSALEPSHVLTAMGLSAEEARQSIRVSFSETNTAAEAEEAAATLARCIRICLEGAANLQSEEG